MSIIEKALEKQRALRNSDPLSDDFPLPETSNKQRVVHPSRPEPSTVDVSARPVATPAVRLIDQYAETVEIDLSKLKNKGMLLPQESVDQFNKDEYRYMRRLSEEYRLIKRPLLANAFSDNGIERANLLLVTSSLPSEGKTFTAINLALSMATERDKSVLLIDADVAKPSVTKTLELEQEGQERAGLIELLESPDVQVSDVLLRTNIPGLSIIPAGKRHRHSTELLASQAMKSFVDNLVQEQDLIVIFDSPPLLAASQGAVLATFVGQVVMVIEAKKTPQHAVQEAVAKLDGCDIIGCVLNKMQKGVWVNYYGYGYGDYGQYGHDKQVNEPK